MKVVIVGGGLAGLTLAHTLLSLDKRNEEEREEGEEGLEVVVLEEGGEEEEDKMVIALHQWGCDALERAGVEDILSPLLFVGGVRDVIMKDHNCNNLMRIPNFMSLKLEGKKYSSLVSRGQLKKKMKENLPKGVIQFNAKGVEVLEREGEGVVVKLEGGQEVKGDVLVGADGERSFIRSHIAPDLTPKSVCGGVFSVSGFIFDPKFQKNDLFEKSCSSLVRITGAFGVSVVMYCPQIHTSSSSSSSQLWWSVSFPKQQATEIRKEVEGEEQRKQHILFELSKILEKSIFNPQLMRIIEKTDEFSSVSEMVSVQQDDLEDWVKAQKRAKKNITLIGDAAHKTTTQAGLGATGAFLDAVELAEELVLNNQNKKDDEEDISRKLRVYERKMKQRATFYLKESLNNTEILHVVRTGTDLYFWKTLMWFVGCCVWVIYLFKRIFGMD